MPRIRTLKPEHRQHRKIGPLDHIAYRLWVGMILEADDEGRLVAHAGQLRALIFPYHPTVTSDEVDLRLHELSDAGLIVLYFVKKCRYAVFPSWRDHQRIDRPQPSILPCPPKGSIHERSSNIRGTFVESSSNIREGKEGKGKEGNGSGTTPLSGERPTHAGKQSSLELARLAIDFLNAKTGRNYEHSDSNLKPLVAIFKRGKTLGDVKTVIARRVLRWKGTEREEFLRPKTLFNATNFDQYLGERPRVGEGIPDAPAVGSGAEPPPVAAKPAQRSLRAEPVADRQP